jgi:hypothetical protein
MRWAEHIACTGGDDLRKGLRGEALGKDASLKRGLDGEILLKCVLKTDGRVWPAFVWADTYNWRAVVSTVMNIGVP